MIWDSLAWPYIGKCNIRKKVVSSRMSEGGDGGKNSMDVVWGKALAPPERLVHDHSRLKICTCAGTYIKMDVTGGPLRDFCVYQGKLRAYSANSYWTNFMYWAGNLTLCFSTFYVFWPHCLILASRKAESRKVNYFSTKITTNKCYATGL